MTGWNSPRDRIAQVLKVPRSVKTYLMLYGLALTLPVMILSAIALGRMAATEYRQIDARAYEIAIDLRRTLDREIDNFQTVLNTLATSPAFAF